MPKKPILTWRSLGDGERDELLQQYLGGKSAEWLIENNDLAMRPETLQRRLQELSAARQIPKVIVGRGDFEKHWELYCKLIGRDPRKSIPTGKKKSGKSRKVIVLCDLHGNPDKELIERVIGEKADLYVMAGDVFDAFAFSKFEKDKHIPIADELANVRATYEHIIKETGAQIVQEQGNHDARAHKYFAQRIEPEFMSLVQWNLLELAAINLPGVNTSKNLYGFTTGGGRKVDGVLENCWIAHVGEDALIAHGEVARKGEGRTVDALVEWIDRWKKPLSWIEPRLVIQAHVHRASMAWAQGGHQIRVEGGFSGEIPPLQYAMNYGTTVYSPPVLGYTVFRQENRAGKWSTDLSSVQFILC